MENFSIFANRGKTMATMTMAPLATVIEPKIKKAMENIGLGERADDLLDMLDEIELDMALKESIEQLDRGEKISVEESIKRIEERLNNGYYLRR
jgi:hypothetical protein